MANDERPARHKANPRKIQTTRKHLQDIYGTDIHPMKELPEPRLRSKKRNENGHSIKSNYENKDFGSIWLTEFLSYEKDRNQSLAKADLQYFTELPGSTVHPHAEKYLAQQTKCIKRKPHKARKVGCMTDHERGRLDELSKLLNEKSKTKLQKNAPYVEANLKLSRVLQRAKLKTHRENMQASQLEDFYELVTRETNAAIVIQSHCRRVLASKYARKFALEKKKSILIQCCMRRYLARKCLKQLREKKSKADQVRKAIFRRYVSRYRRRKRKKLESQAAVVCQSAIRMYFAKCQLTRMRLQLHWQLNQKRWRSVSTRLAWKRLRTNIQARKIQCMVRRKLAIKRVALLTSLYNKSALKIQCAWRRYLAKIRKDEIVYKKLVDTRSRKIRLISAEKHYWKQKIDHLTKASNIQQLKELEAQKIDLEKQLIQKQKEIFILESHYKDLLDHQRQITPRAIDGGWEEQLKINLKDVRERITTAKFDFLFGIQKKLKKVENEVKLIQSTHEDASRSLNHWSDWHQTEQDQLWEMLRQRNRDMDEKEKRRSVIDEQMRWAVKHCVPSGKPDKRRPLQMGSSDSGERIQQLIDIIQLKTDEVQAQQHLMVTFKPIQRAWDQCNHLLFNIMNGVNEQKNKNERDTSTIKAMPRQSLNTSSHLEADPFKIDLKNASLYPPRHPFSNKLPWALLEKVRKDRQDTITTLLPK